MYFYSNKNAEFLHRLKTLLTGAYFGTVQTLWHQLHNYTMRHNYKTSFIGNDSLISTYSITVNTSALSIESGSNIEINFHVNSIHPAQSTTPNRTCSAISYLTRSELLSLMQTKFMFL